MDAFRNAKEIARINGRMGKIEDKLNQEMLNPREDKIDYALEAFQKSEAKHAKIINIKLLLLILLWVLDKVIILFCFRNLLEDTSWKEICRKCAKKEVGTKNKRGWDKLHADA